MLTIPTKEDCPFWYPLPSNYFFLTKYLGPPGSGKGTQANRITNELCSCHISTGDLLRKEIRDGTELGMKAKEVMNSGGLVSDDLVLQILKKKVDAPECKKGVIFDGFPRTVEQAKKLDEILATSNNKIDQVFNFHIDDSVLVDRYKSREKPCNNEYID